MKIDVLIIGAGINGAGLFRDLCEQGLTCVIVDKGDFGGGTSAAPSRLIHGGIKYLETGEFRLVAQSTLERNLLLKNAPHLVKPLRTVIPMFSWTKGVGAALRTLLGSTTAPRERGAVLIKIGMALYDMYGARHRVMPKHSFWSKRRALRELPLTDRIVAAGVYYDAAITAPERLVMELVQDGLRSSPASRALTYAETVREGDSLRIIGAETVTVTPDIVVNAAGPWIDQVNAIMGEETRMIGGTKGSHILLDHPELVAALDGRMIYYEADDGRICLVFPYLGKALVGSTDIRADDPDGVFCSETETQYFLDSLRRLLPGITVSVDQIVYTYAGIRPLPNSEGTAAGLISRDHSAPVLEPTETRPFPIISLVGGKWTTFRGFAEEVADDLLKRLDKPRKVSTQDLPIGGGRDFQETGTGLAKRYGSTARHMPAPDTPLVDAPNWSEEEILWIARNEQVTHLADIVLRRTQLAITGQLTARNVDRIAELTGQALNWSTDRIEIEKRRTREELARRHSVNLG